MGSNSQRSVIGLCVTLNCCRGSVGVGGGVEGLGVLGVLGVLGTC